MYHSICSNRKHSCCSYSEICKIILFLYTSQNISW